MPGIIIEPEDKKTNPLIGIFSDLGRIYILILGVIWGVVYCQGIYQNKEVFIYIPFTHIWPFTLIAVGLSIFKVKSSVSLSGGIFFLALAITMTVFSVSIRTNSIKTNTETISNSINGVKSINTNMSFTTTDISIKGGSVGIDGQYTSNYGIITSSITNDKDFVQNISLKQLDIQPGFGSYTKKLDLAFPKNIPAIFDITADISSLSLDLRGIPLKSANITLRGSEASIILDQIESGANLNVNSRASQVTITIPRNIKVLLTTSHSLTTNDMIGLVQKGLDSKIYEIESGVYESSNYQASNDNEEKIMTVNLNSTLARIKIIQQ
jgi:hypothetical protein